MRWGVSLAGVLAAALLWTAGASAIAVYEVKVASEADVLVYLVDQESQADVEVYTSKYASDGANPSGLIWYFTPLRSKAKLKVYFVQYPPQADLLVYYTDRDFKAAWLNTMKKARFSDLLK